MRSIRGPEPQTSPQRSKTKVLGYENMTWLNRFTLEAFDPTTGPNKPMIEKISDENICLFEGLTLIALRFLSLSPYKLLWMQGNEASQAL